MLKTWRFALHFAFANNMSKIRAGTSGQLRTFRKSGNLLRWRITDSNR